MPIAAERGNRMRYFATAREVREFVLCHDTSTIAAIGGLVNAGSGIYSSVQQQDIARNAESQRNAQYNKLNALSDPKTLLANIMKMKQSLTESQKDMITQAVTSRLVQQGQGGATGLIQEAVDQALQQADNQLFQEAASTYLSSVGLPLNALRGQPPAGLGNPNQAATGAFSALSKLLHPPKTGLSQTDPAPLPDLPVSGNTVADYFANTPAVPSDSSTSMDNTGE